PVAIRLDVDDAKQRLRGSLGAANGEGSLRFAVEAGAPLPAVRRGETSLLAAPIRGDFKAEATDLRYLSGLLPDVLYDLTGAFSSDLALRGSLGQPELRGSARLAKAGITVVPLQQRFRDLNLEV